MVRPVPLFESPELVDHLQPGALDTQGSKHGGYIGENVSGDVLVVARSSDRLSRLVEAATVAPDSTSVIGRLNDTGTTPQIKDHELDIPDGQRFDTIVYTKEKTAWFGRSGDFHRLTPLLKHGGTLLGKTKWVPDSERLRLEEIAATGFYQFEAPEVYLKWTKEQRTLAAFGDGATSTAAPDGGVQAQSAATAGDALRTVLRDESTQFTYGDEKTDYSPGWSWHTELKRYVEEWCEQFDGDIANLCCGTNSLGDIRVDQLLEYTDKHGETHETAANLQADATSVPRPRNSVDAVITDPPWKVPPKQRARLFSEAQRLVRPGGRILQNSWWVPTHPYATPTEIRPVIANVTDDSIHGPGGLSFLSEYKVHEQPDFGDATYTLAGHIDDCGLDHVDAYRGGRIRNPWEEPANDPRFVSPGGAYQCEMCGCTQFHKVTIPREVLYECRDCGFRHGPEELAATAST